MQKLLVNRIAIVLDRSSSMHSLRQETVNALNANIAAIKAAAEREGQAATISLYTFSDKVTREHFNTPVEKFKPWKLEDYRTAGMTALFDGVGQAVDELRAMPDAGEENVSFVIMAITDGEANVFSRYTAATLKQLIRKCEVTDRWTFAFLVPPGQGGAFARQFAMNPGNVQEWDASVKGIKEYEAQTSGALDNYFKARSSGQRSVQRGFFTNLADLKPADVKKELTDIKAKVKVLDVPREEDIRPFVEKELGHYPKGQCYYELTKSETVQGYKQVLIMQKGKKAIFGGSAEEMRAIIGVPDSNAGSIRLKPGNHGDWDVFIQSTSVNRKLVRGTRLLVVQ